METKEVSLVARISRKGETTANEVDTERDATKGGNIELLNLNPTTDTYMMDADLRISMSYFKSKRRGRITVNANSAPGLATRPTIVANFRLSRPRADRNKVLRIRNRLITAVLSHPLHQQISSPGKHPSLNLSPEQPK
jgi:hypothetical protein